MSKKWIMSALSAALLMISSTTIVNATESKVLKDEKVLHYTYVCEVNEEKMPVLQGESKTDATGNYQYEELEDGSVQITQYVGTQTDVVIPSELDGKKVTKIGREAFYWTEIVSVEVPETVVFIGEQAFAECSSLERIRLSAGLKELGEGAFVNCSSLKTIEVDEKNTAFVAEDNILYTKDKQELIRYGVGRDKVVVPAGVKIIGMGALSAIDAKEVVLPEGIISLKDYALINNFYMEKVSFPESLREIGYGALASTGVTEVYIHKNITNIGEAAFGFCLNMVKMEVDPANTKYMMENDFLLTRDKKLLLHSVGDKTRIVIPNGVEKIGDLTFSCKFNMKEVIFPQGLKEISMAAFDSCAKLEEVMIPASVKKVGEYAFDWCSVLKKVTVLSKDCCYGEEGILNVTDVFPKSAVLYGYVGSTLQEYATRNNMDFVSIDNETIIADIPMSSWQYPYVKMAIENAYVVGKKADEYGNVIFDPESKMTRAEFIQLLYNKEGKSEVTYEQVFSDVPDNKWFSKAIVWGYKNNLISGKNGVFDVSGNITREEVATILYKYAANLKKYNTTGAADLAGYEDANAISDWAVNNMKWAIQHNIMKGRGSYIAAQDNASRAECITMLINFINEYEKNE